MEAIENHSGQSTQVFSSSCDEKVTTLDTTQFKKWTKEEVRSMLCTDEDKGGAGLTVEQVQPLYDAGFKGSYIANTISSIKEDGKKDAIEQLEKQYVKAGIPLTFELSITLKTFVNWVDKLGSLPDVITRENVNKLGIERLYFPESKETTQQLPTSILLSSFGSNFEFVERQTTVKEALKVFKSRSDTSVSIDKQYVILPFIAAAPGVGKSRLLKEIGLYFTKSSIRKEVTAVSLFVSFGNATSLATTETDILTSLVVRMIFSALVQRGGSKYSPGQFYNFLNRWNQFSRNKKLNLSEALIVISYILGIKDKKIDYFLGIDEAHVLDSNSRKQEANPLKQIISIIGQFISANEPTNKLYAMFAGTYYTPIRECLVDSTYSPKFLPLSTTLSPVAIETILDNLVTTYPKELQYWRTNSEFRHYLRRFSGFPRGVEYFLERFIQKNRKETIASIWDTTRSALQEKYGTGLDPEVAKYLAKCVFSKETVKYLSKPSQRVFQDILYFGSKCEIKPLHLNLKKIVNLHQIVEQQQKNGTIPHTLLIFAIIIINIQQPTSNTLPHPSVYQH